MSKLDPTVTAEEVYNKFRPMPTNVTGGAMLYRATGISHGGKDDSEFLNTVMALLEAAGINPTRLEQEPLRLAGGLKASVMYSRVSHGGGGHTKAMDCILIDSDMKRFKNHYGIEASLNR